MSKSEEKKLEERINELDKDYERVSIGIDAAERAASDGQDLSAIQAMKFGYEQREEIVSARSHLQGQLDYMQAQSRDRDNVPEANAQKDWWAKKDPGDPASTSRIPADRPMLANQSVRTSEPSRAGNDWWRIDTTQRQEEPEHEPDRNR
ncbi:hypothetical protein ACQVP2_33230 [Methylobacterium aquaticum]|uniref:hypothetical protein n=1 Tax=Methylobacterium aquaticum TaxID=270351 RepID=UPI003D16C1E4